LTSTAPLQLHGTIRLRGTLTNTSGWSRSFWLGPVAAFAGDRALAAAHVNLASLESLANRVSSQIGAPGGSYTLAVMPRVKIAGEIGGALVSTEYAPSLSLALGDPQLLSGTSAVGPASSTASASTQTGLIRTTTGSVTSSRRSTNSLGGVPVDTVRWISLVALALFSAAALLTGSRELNAVTGDPIERINSRYKHLIVPVAEMAASPDHPPIEVSSIAALAQLAERSERLILHEHRDDGDSYLIDDQGTLFRYQEPSVGAARSHSLGHDVEDDRGAISDDGGAIPEAGDKIPDGLSAMHGEDDHTEDVAAIDPVADATADLRSLAAGRAVEASEPLASVRSHALREPRDVASDTSYRQPAPRQAAADTMLPWGRRPEARLGVAIGPLALALLAWWRLRAKRLRARQAEFDDRWTLQRGARQPPQRASRSDRRRGDRRRSVDRRRP
jgi:hypothetical protein